METFISILGELPSGSLAPVALLLLAAGGSAVGWSLVMIRGERGDLKRRLRVETQLDTGKQELHAKKNTGAVREKAARTALEFYAKSDPENVARLRLKLVQAGYMDSRAVGMFFLIRIASLAACAVAAVLLTRVFGDGNSAKAFWTLVIMAAGFGYFLPGFVLGRMVHAKVVEYRNGFPDFMDLMIVCSDAGMSMEAGIDRVSKELALTYPSLSLNLQLVSLELRAGRSLDDALKALADRLSLDEIRSFATLLQQSKELGTSLAGALRVFSDEMRHKRMSIAEEKAHALPAKMSVPVTVCILPVILMIAIIPIIVKMTAE